MWTLRRMKLLDVDPTIICDVYVKEIRSLLELAVPAWHSGLTKKQSGDIERVQKVAVGVILGDRNGNCYLSYNMAMAALELEPLHCRREKLCPNTDICSWLTEAGTTPETGLNMWNRSATLRDITTLLSTI